ncbi:30S ribosomal protein S16, putative [Theileria annulata]|uniref:30S ribosomal protein S16, putative n=1 Tax=Theileria annulata TaxID=5874 RepID=Q4UHQ4_THEAN|nr:30S ribosomal protein S16, putative [Theileria annulata]CAI73385.1 30S ribosomal protein S16, putative [Theileria annulata]|eukprot:XP_954062.1 30S ribosomal protein S16, putative [Theileria annulata]
MINRMFLPYYSKSRGPPRLRFQVMGKRGKRFLMLVAANQRDPRDGKHMEVLGSVQRRPINPIPSSIGENHESLSEIRLRFSRIKFWLGVGCDMNVSVATVLSQANLIPPHPPKFGERTRGHFHLLSQIVENRQQVHLNRVKTFLLRESPCVNDDEDVYKPDLEETPARIVQNKIYPPELKELDQAAHFDITEEPLNPEKKVLRKLVR